jgi:hypothetical protein
MPFKKGERHGRAVRPTDHPQRVMPGQGNKLAVEAPREGFVRRWVTNIPGRLEEMQQYGYTFVENTGLVANALDSSEASALGTRITRPSGGGNIYYLMEIREDWYQENQDYKQAQIDEIEKAMKPSGPNGYAPKYNGREINGLETETE